MRREDVPWGYVIGGAVLWIVFVVALWNSAGCSVEYPC